MNERPASLGERVHRRLSVGYENPLGLRGSVQFEIVDTAERFFVTFHDETLGYSAGVAGEPAARIAMNAKTAADVATGPNLDLANEKNWDLIRTEGDVVLLGALAQLTKLPRGDARERFERAEASARSRPPVTEVLRLAKPTSERVRDALEASQPLVVTHFLEDFWPEGSRLTFERLRREYGDVTVRTTDGSMTIRDLLDLAFGGDPEAAPYTLGAPAPDALSHLFPPPFLDPAKFGPAQIWLGSRPDAVSTPLHRDSAPAFLGQLVGRKEWIIVSPDQAGAAYAKKSYNRDQPCWADLWSPDYERFPKLREVRALRFLLSPGEMAIIPPGWFHTVRALDVTCSIGFHYDPVTDFGHVLD